MARLSSAGMDMSAPGPAVNYSDADCNCWYSSDDGDIGRDCPYDGDGDDDDLPGEYITYRPSPLDPARYKDITDSEHLESYRTTRAGIGDICDIIRDDPAFTARQKYTVLQQVLMAMYYIGHSADIVAAAAALGTSNGTIVNVTRRVYKAVYDRRTRFLAWPTPDERRAHGQHHADNNGLPGCIGYVDGTHIQLMHAPDGPDLRYYSAHKKAYTINVMAVADSAGLFTYVKAGCPGSWCDSKIYTESRLHNNPGEYFDDDEYLLGDSGYELNMNLMTPYPEAIAGQRGNGSLRAFNSAHSEARSAIDRAFERLRWRFPRLRSLPTRLGSYDSRYNAMCMIFAAFCLYNHCQRIGGEPETSDGPSDMPGDEPSDATAGVDASGEAADFRSELAESAQRFRRQQQQQQQ